MKTRMMTRILSLLALVLCLCMVLTACAPGAETPDATKDSQDTANTEKNSEASSTSGTTTKLKLAAIIPVTGNNMQYGISYENALKMAVDDFNAAGGLNGQQIELVIHDDKGDQTEAINVAYKVIDDPDVFAVVGSFGSAVSMAIAPIFEEAGIPFLSPNTSHVDFPGMGEYLLPICPVKTTEISTFAKTLVEKLGAKDLAVVYANNDTGVLSEATISEVWADCGGKVVSSENYISGETQDFTPILSKVKEANPEIIYLTGGYNDIANIILQAQKIGLNNVQFVGPGDVLLQEFLDLVGTSADGIILGGTTPVYSDELLTEEAFSKTVVDFKNRYNELYPDSTCDGFAACAYDAAMLAMQAASHVGTDDGMALVKEIETMDYDCVSAIAMHYENGNTVVKDVCIYTIKDGKFTNY